MLTDFLIHFEHIHLRLPEHSHHLLVAYDLALIFWVLQIVAFDMLPESLDHLRAWELFEVRLSQLTERSERAAAAR